MNEEKNPAEWPTPVEFIPRWILILFTVVASFAMAFFAFEISYFAGALATQDIGIGWYVGLGIAFLVFIGFARAAWPKS